MAEEASDGQWAESLKALLSGSSIKIEPPTVMATSPALNVRLNVNTLLNLTYDLLTRGNFNDEKPGVRYEERSAQTTARKSSVRCAKGTQSSVSVGVQVDDFSEIEKRELLERQNQILTRSILDCHMQYTRHKISCNSCPPLTLPKELQELYQQTSGDNGLDFDDATEMHSPSPSPPSPIARDPNLSVSPDPDCKPSSAAATVTADMDVDLNVPPSELMDTNDSHCSEMSRSLSLSNSIESPRSSPAISTHQTTASVGQASVEPVDAPDEKPALDSALLPAVYASRSPTSSNLPEFDISREDEDEGVYSEPEPRRKVVVSELWWREQMNQVVMNRFQGTTLLECHTCETAPNPSYKSFNDDEEDINEQIQVHFEEKHPEESYALKRCSNAHLEILRSLRYKTT